MREVRITSLKLKHFFISNTFREVHTRSYKLLLRNYTLKVVTWLKTLSCYGPADDGISVSGHSYGLSTSFAS